MISSEEEDQSRHSGLGTSMEIRIFFCQLDTVYYREMGTFLGTAKVRPEIDIFYTVKFEIVRMSIRDSLTIFFRKV